MGCKVHEFITNIQTKLETSMKLSYVIFSHGKESGPKGSKIQRLMAEAERLGLNTVSVDYRHCATASERVARTFWAAC